MEDIKNILNKIKENGYEIIFLGIGAQKANTYCLTNEKVEKMYNANEFLEKYNIPTYSYTPMEVKQVLTD